MLTGLPSLCVTHAPLRCVDIATHATTREPAQWVWCGGCCTSFPLPPSAPHPRPKFCAGVVPFPVHTHGGSCLSPASTDTLKRVKRQSRMLLQRLWPKRNFRVDGLLQRLGSLLLHLKPQARVQAAGALLRAFWADAWWPRSQGPRPGRWRGRSQRVVFSCSPAEANKAEIQLMENKQLLKNNKIYDSVWFYKSWGAGILN